MAQFSFDMVPKAPKYARYFVKYGDVFKGNRGFRTIKEVDEWMDSLTEHLEEQDPIILRIRFKDDLKSIFIVDRVGKVCRR